MIGAVLVHGAKAPYVIKREQLKLMKPNAVLVDVAIDQGAASRPRSRHPRGPDLEVDGITHYCVANMPGAVPITSTYALTNATLPYALSLADNGLEGAIEKDAGLRAGVNVAGGKVTCGPSPSPSGTECAEVEDALSQARSGSGRYFSTRISFLLTNSSIPYLPSSRPKPERLTPPNGSSTPSRRVPFTNTIPVSRPFATRST